MDSRTYTQKTTGYDGEGRITSALMYVTNDKMPAVYTLTGHEKAVLGSRFSDALQKLNISSKALDRRLPPGRHPQGQARQDPGSHGHRRAGAD